GLVAPDMGWAMNGLGLWLTLDGGKTWRTITPPNVSAAGDAVARVNQIEFVDKRDGWISASDIPGRAPLLRHLAIDRTTDGGRTWKSVIPPGCALCGGTQLSFLDARHGYALLGPPPQSRLYETANGGETWRLIANPPFVGAIEFLNRSTALAVTRSGVLYRTTDGGSHWQKVQLRAPPAYVAFQEAAGV